MTRDLARSMLLSREIGFRRVLEDLDVTVEAGALEYTATGSHPNVSPGDMKPVSSCRGPGRRYCHPSREGDGGCPLA